MTTLIKKHFNSVNDLENFLNQSYNNHEHAEQFKHIVRVGFRYDILNEPTKKKRETKELFLEWLYKKYIKGINSKTIVRVGKKMGTTPDRMVDVVVGSHLDLPEGELADISLKHRLSMQAENIIGSLLEDYLDSELSKLGWVCCYGEVLKHSDFCHSDGYVLQVKNRDNTENAASKAIRNGRPYIKMWFRTFSKSGLSNWEKLKDVLTEYGHDHSGVNLTEDGFIEFSKIVMAQNKKLLKV